MARNPSTHGLPYSGSATPIFCLRSDGCTHDAQSIHYYTCFHAFAHIYHLLTWKNLPLFYLKSAFPKSMSSSTFPSRAICLASYKTQRLKRQPNFHEWFPVLLARSLGRKLIHSFALKEKQTLDSGLPRGL